MIFALDNTTQVVDVFNWWIVNHGGETEAVKIYFTDRHCFKSYKDTIDILSYQYTHKIKKSPYYYIIREEVCKIHFEVPKAIANRALTYEDFLDLFR